MYKIQKFLFFYFMVFNQWCFSSSLSELDQIKYSLDVIKQNSWRVVKVDTQDQSVHDYLIDTIMMYNQASSQKIKELQELRYQNIVNHLPLKIED